MVLPVILIIIGFILLIKGADFLVEGSSNIAKKFHIPEILIGLTIVSIGTSMPELFVSVTSAIQGRSDMAMGNVIDTLIIQNGSMIRTIVLLFYLSHEGITILENVEKLDLPIPQKCMEISLYTVSAVLFLKFLSFFLLWGQSFVSGAIGRDAPLEIKIQFCQFVVKKDLVTLLFVSYLEFSDANYIRNLYRFCVIYSV